MIVRRQQRRPAFRLSLDLDVGLVRRDPERLLIGGQGRAHATTRKAPATNTPRQRRKAPQHNGKCTDEDQQR
ncbi:hypothetical protein [Streptomyces griseus]|uniref:hypothetical protein n=1 Tax=Streptomyces griseus TaxID=1911 RepID=UPI00131A8F8F|nr:hypothetical protein [Streptomyces griseus]